MVPDTPVSDSDEDWLHGRHGPVPKERNRINYGSVKMTIALRNATTSFCVVGVFFPFKGLVFLAIQQREGVMFNTKFNYLKIVDIKWDF